MPFKRRRKATQPVDYPDAATPRLGAARHIIWREELVVPVPQSDRASRRARRLAPTSRPHRTFTYPWPALELRLAICGLSFVREWTLPPAGGALDSRKLSSVVDRWERRQKKLGRRSVDETRRILEIHVVPTLGDHQVETLRRRDVIEVLEKLRDEKGLGPQVNRVQRAISGVLGYAVDADLIEVNPIAGLKPQVAEGSQGRVLSVEELSKVWRACDGISPTAAGAARLLILSGQRREEVTGMSWPELDYDHASKSWTAGRLWTIPAARMKSKRDHVVPLSLAACEIIEAQPRGAGGDFVFSATLGRTSFAGWRRAAPALAKSAALASPWTLHDLRRSGSTGLGEVLNIDEGIIGRVLGHSSRSRIGVTARYELSQRLAHVRAALDAWAALILDRVAADDGRNVVAFPTAAA